MKHLGVQTAILSTTAPGPCVESDPSAQAALARQLNEYAASLRDEDHATFGFFASLPDIRNSTAALAEIAYAFDTLKADGVTLFTSYGPNGTYLGHSDLDPVWRELNKREAVVFVHPSHPANSSGPVNAYLPDPVVDYPHETTRTAMDLITSQTLKRYPNVKVVLSHAGGTLPYIIGRLAVPLRKTPGVVASWMAGTTHDEAMAAFRSFYYDVALSTSSHVLRTLLEMVPHDHIVYGVSCGANEILSSPPVIMLTGWCRAISHTRPGQRILPSWRNWSRLNYPRKCGVRSTIRTPSPWFRDWESRLQN